MWITDVKAGTEITLTDNGTQVGRIVVVEKSRGGLQLSLDVPLTTKITKSQERKNGSISGTLVK